MVELPPPVLTKRNFVDRYRKGEFGNASPTYDTFKEFYALADGGLFHLRNRIAGGETHYNLTRRETLNLWTAVKEPGQWYASEMAPNAKTILQGELMETERGLYLYYSTVAKPMREALREKSSEITGIIATFLLRQALCPNSYEWLMELLRLYPGHVVEFSAYSCKWGTLYPKFNTVFWEVRGGY